MSTMTYSFRLNIESITSGFAIPYEPMGRAGVDAWQTAYDLMSHQRYPSPKGSIEISADWHAVRDKFKKTVSFELLSPKEKTKYLRNLLKNDKDVLQVNFDVTVTENSEKVDDASKMDALYYLDVFLHEFFLAMNLASPGCCDFYSAVVLRNAMSPYPINLHAGFLENAWHNAVKNNWSFINAIPLSKVLSWLHALNIGSRQVAKTRTERALFALLQLCKYSSYNPNALIWIAHALEALYDSPQALITRSLQDRVCRVLAIPVERQKVIRKSLRNFYDARSSFVHGTMEITHPLENEYLDSSTDKCIAELVDVIHFGTYILIATLQWHIVNECKEVNFSEIFTKVPL